MGRLAIDYREFWKVPRMFAVEAQPGRALVFDCPFDDASDDYDDFFNVWSIEAPLAEAIGRYLSLDATPAPVYLGVVGVGDVQFDVTRKKTVDPGVLERISGRR